MALRSTASGVRGLRWWALVAALGLAAGLAAACGGGDAPTTERSAPQSAAERAAPTERSTEAARPAPADTGADRAPANDAASALQASRQRSVEVDQETKLEACRRLAEENPDQAAQILEACESGELTAFSSTASVVTINPYVVGPVSVSLNGVGNDGPLPMRLGPQEYRCDIVVTQHRTDEAAGGFSATFSGDSLPAQTVELEGPSWSGEATLPAGGEGLREIRLVVQADAEDAEWRVTCSQRSS